ncbi:MAG TPA: archaetidylserine decarboxylase [Candidatus Didemnitutus sp.]|nr:archaetidylserine decarboxylase [Candidatus Didemnitutus sp.]
MTEPVQYFHRARQKIEIETIYGDRWLRWTYGNPLGRLTLEIVVKRALLSRLYGWQMNRRFSAQRVLPFISTYDVDVDEFVKSPFVFKTFNDFFYRALKSTARPIVTGDGVAVLPADGRHLAFADVGAQEGYYVKGQRFSLAGLFGESDRPEAERNLTREFAGGSILISRLCPVDYHRFHFPVAGTPGESRLINGWLYSVSPIALRRNLAYLWENKRMVTVIESPQFGRVAMVEVGATMVGSILETFSPGKEVAKGDEKGLFRFGGSCVITLFQKDRIRFDEDFLEQSARQTEVYARMGERLGTAVSGQKSEVR